MEATLTHGSIARTLIRLTSPQVLGFFAVISLNMVDTYFIAQLGTQELAGVTFTFPVVMILMNLAMGLSIGAGSVLSRAIGAGRSSKQLTTAALVLGVGLMTAATAFCLPNMHAFFALLGTPPELYPYVRAYMYIWFLGLPILAVPMIANAAINASGDTKLPAVIMCTAAFSNLMLDPLLIFGYGGFPRLETEGAAIATVISYGVAFLFSLLFLYRKRMLTYYMPFASMVHHWKQILAIGVPAAATQMIIPLSNAGSLWILSHFGASVIAAYGIVCRLESFSLIAIIALGTSLSAFAGQNYGAKLYDRAQKALKVSYLFALIWGAVLASLLRFFSKTIATVFNPDPQVIGTVTLFLSIVPLTYGALGCVFLASSYFNAIGMPIRASVLALSRHFVLYLPLAYLGSLYLGPIGVFSAMACVNVLAALAAYIWSLQMGQSWSVLQKKG